MRKASEIIDISAPDGRQMQITFIARPCAGQHPASSFEIEVEMGHGMFLA